MPTSNTYISPEDGWVEIVDSPSFLRLSQYPVTHSFYVYSDTSEPTVSDPSGMQCVDKPFIVSDQTSDKFWVRATTVTPNGLQTGRLRIDALWVGGSAPPSPDSFILMDNGNFIIDDAGNSVILG